MLTPIAAILAHAGDHGPPHGPWWAAWNLDPLILPNLLLLSALYAWGLRAMWRRAGAGRGVTRAQAAAFAGGILALVAALLSPIDVLALELSWVHMVQHMLIMMVAAPLLIVGTPTRVLLWALPRRWRPGIGGWSQRLGQWRPARYALWQPFLMAALYALTLWLWHVPALYEAALGNKLIHDVQHLAFLAAACLFWRVLLDPISRRRLNLGLGVLYLFVTSLHSSALGVLLTLSPRVWYPHYERTTARWDLTALEDQQLAGLIMWLPACTIYAIVVAAMFALWMSRLQEPQDAQPAAPPPAPPAPPDQTHSDWSLE